MIIHSYIRGSQSAKALRDALEELGEHTVILHRRPMRPKARIISWGTKELNYDLKGLGGVLNPPEITKILCNKLSFFQHVGDKPYVPNWTTSSAEAKEKFDIVCVRHKLAGKSGEGIEILENPNRDIDIPKAPLYTEYMKKTDEYRLHVFREGPEAYTVGFVQKKVRRPDVEVKDWRVRNHENGFLFQQNGFEVPGVVSKAALDLVSENFPMLDFVALDVIYHRTTDKAYVLEGNTAPGIEGNTAKAYAEFFLSRKQNGWTV